MKFNTNYGTHSTYEEYRNALIAYHEHEILHNRVTNGQVTLQDLRAYSDTHSIAIGYGFDCLVRDNHIR